MRTFPRRTYSHARLGRRGGFTFIEVMVALTILTALTLIVLPNMQRLLQGEREREFRRLANVIRMAKQEAVLTRVPHRLVFDLRLRQYHVESRTETGEYETPADRRALAPHRFPEAFEFIDLLLYGERTERLLDREVTIRLDPSGFVDRFVLHLRDGQDEEEWTFRASLLGRADWQEGYIDDPLL